MLSGGADSSNVLYSFLNNNIRVDEVIAYGPFCGIKNLDVNLQDKRPENTVAETLVTQMPLINMISQKYPNIKITLHDYFEDILKMKSDEWIYESAGHWIHYSGSTRHSLDKFHHLRNLAEAGKKIAFLGWAFKKDTNDTRESAAIYVADDLLNEQATIAVFDPKVNEAQMLSDLDYLGSRPQQENQKQLKAYDNPYEACNQAHAIAVLTEWDEFKAYDWQKIYDHMLKPAFIFDGRNILDKKALEQIGFVYKAIGS
jgi:antirestriction protein